MEDLQLLRRTPFAIAAAVTLVVAVAIFRLPEEFVANLRAGRPFSATQAGWIVRLLVLAAVTQAAYVGFAILRPEKVEAARERDGSLGAESPEGVARSVARNAALVPLLTLVYGASTVALTGERGTFWLFLVIALAQLAWYYRAAGEIAGWMSLQQHSALEAQERAPGDRALDGAPGHEDAAAVTDDHPAPPATT